MNLFLVVLGNLGLTEARLGSNRGNEGRSSIEKIRHFYFSLKRSQKQIITQEYQKILQHSFPVAFMTF